MLCTLRASAVLAFFGPWARRAVLPGNWASFEEVKIGIWPWPRPNRPNGKKGLVEGAFEKLISATLASTFLFGPL